MTAPLVFLDTETTGLTLDDDLWEIAAIRRDTDGIETPLHLFVEHDPAKCGALPERFLADHRARYRADDAIPEDLAALVVHDFFTHPHSDVKPHVVGAVPNFDTERLARLFARYGFAVPWHYHLIDVENLAVGYLAGVGKQAANDGELSTGHVEDGLRRLAPPWRSDDLAAAVGVTITEDERHTALGDAAWALRIYDAVMGGVA